MWSCRLESFIEHVPSFSSATVTPDTVHTVVESEANATANPELALALRLNGSVPRTRVLSVPKVMVWGLPATVNVCVIDAAAA